MLLRRSLSAEIRVASLRKLGTSHVLLTALGRIGDIPQEPRERRLNIRCELRCKARCRG